MTVQGRTDRLLTASFQLDAARRVKLARVGVFDVDASGAADFPVREQQWVDPAGGGYAYREVVRLPAGTFSVQPAYQLLDGEWVNGPQETLHIVDMIALVQQAYRDILHREPRGDDLDGYLRSNKTIETIRAELATWMRNAITLAYQSVLGRDPVTGEVDAYMTSGKSLEQIEAELQAYRRNRVTHTRVNFRGDRWNGTVFIWFTDTFADGRTGDSPQWAVSGLPVTQLYYVNPGPPNGDGSSGYQWGVPSTRIQGEIDTHLGFGLAEGFQRPRPQVGNEAWMHRADLPGGRYTYTSVFNMLLGFPPFVPTWVEARA